jgi:ornithine--oxo-acid transaminase
MTQTLINPKTQIDLENRLGAHNYHPLEVVLARGEGVWVWDMAGKKHLDCLSAYSALNQGHCHPEIINALVTQASRVTLTSRAFFNDQLGPLYESLTRILGFEAVLPMNTGAEAVETAIKLVRKWAYTSKKIPLNQAEIIVMGGNFQGRTTTIISFSSEGQYKDLFGPLTPGFVTVPYGDAAALEAAINPNTAAIMLEPIQGEAGVVVPPDGYLRAVRDACDKHGLLMVADEIQTGLGRTGKWLACDHENVRPDVVILGKALGGGVYPVSAVISSRSVMDVFQPGDHGSTFGGNPLGAAVAQASLRVLENEKLPERALEMGAYFRAGLAAMHSPRVREVRGKGLLIGLELDTAARPYCEALKNVGVLCKETHDTVIRFAPPLVIEKSDIDWALERIAPILKH